MYLQRISISNIRSISSFTLKFEDNEFPGWHVIIGPNGSGKSTLVRALALMFVGPTEVAALRQDWKDWLRDGTEMGSIRADYDYNRTLDKVTGKGKGLTKYYVPASLAFYRGKRRIGSTVDVVDRTNYLKVDPHRYIWGEGDGWFCASYGPFRRFTGGSREFEKLYYAYPKLAPHLSAFGEAVALTESIEWLQQLHVKRLEKKPEGKILDSLQRFINEGELLPHNTVLEEVTADAVTFRDGNGCVVQVDQLSDGYRSVLSMTFELIKQMVMVYGHEKVFTMVNNADMRINLPGVVVIDEIDAHMHPTWQRKIGPWFCRYFPKIQFIVTSHSPLVCQAAEYGTVWRLPTPGEDPSDTERSGRITGVELQRLLYGSVLEAYDTGLFGTEISRSESSKEMLRQLAMLNRKNLRKKLTTKERRELERLMSILATTSTITGEE